MDSKLAERIGKTARRTREALGLSQADVAERLKKSPEFYGRLERGGTLPSVETLAELSRVLGVGADALLGTSGGSSASAKDVAREELTPKERLILRRLRRASPRAVRLVGVLLGEFERVAGTARRKRTSSGKRQP
ncbi:MAG TPA: helix-turn-helix transcriptional regulator [Lacunisphaera sp.]|nr:helix-turn-helix transcriptional regulator [Lacunisphaera sp.]